jgi:transposase
MMGCKARDVLPAAVVSRDDLVPADYFYRQLERVLDLSFARELVHECYAPSGRPSIDPVIFFKLQLVMFTDPLLLHWDSVRENWELTRQGVGGVRRVKIPC